MAEEGKLEKRDIVKKQLEQLRAQHLHHLLVAIGKSHPDLDRFEQQDRFIKRIDEALGYLKQYPKGGYTLAEEAPDSPKVFAFIQRFFPQKKPSEPTD